DEAVAAVAAHLAAVDADVVHNHMYRAEVIGTQAAWALAAAGRRRPFVVGTVHSSRIRSEKDRDLLRRLTPRMDHLVAVSRAIVRKLADEGRVGAPISLIYNGVDLARYSEQAACPTLLSEYAIPAGEPIVGVAVLPSYREAQGLSILEAMALSRPVVASAVGGIPEMIDDGRTGLLVPPRDPGALAAAIVRLLQHPDLAARLGRAGHDLVHERFCVEQMVRAVETISDDAVAAGRTP